jgi:hypothetical protein
MEEGRQRRLFVVTGMHRSHTSMLGRMLVDAGMRFHDELVDGDTTNPYGHYEDVDILELQRAALRRVGARWYRGIARPIALTGEERSRLHAIVAARYAELGDAWGFKVPDSALFLDEWASFPEARFLLVFRDPRAVLSSLYRRMGRQFWLRPDAILSMARAYCIYNERILRLRAAEPERTFLIDSADLVADPERTIAAAASKLGFPAPRDWNGERLVDTSIRSAPSQPAERAAARLLSRSPRVQRIYRQLRAASDSGR